MKTPFTTSPKESLQQQGHSSSPQLVAYLGEELQADTAFIGELQTKNNQPTIQTIAAYSNHQPTQNFEYNLANTPCENVVGRNMCVYNDNVAQKFPKDIALVKNGIEGYIGAPLFSSEGKAIGIHRRLIQAPHQSKPNCPIYCSNFCCSSSCRT